MPPAHLQTSTHAEASSSPDTKPPPLVALFLIKFDLKVGYTIAWKRSLDQVPLEGIVEYKSLPSGLHNVHDDLVYFSHEQYAGISAFSKCSASVQERNAHFVAVGAMLPLKDGRLGRAWLHAKSLKKLSKELVQSSDNVSSLEEYWQEHGASAEDHLLSPQLSPFTLAQRKSRALSTATLATDEKQSLPCYHPALAILDYIDVFGPLIYPIHRAALLRKRILLITSPPVRQSCEFVYDLSVFSSTPMSLASSLTLPSESLVRLRPLFSLGIHDIPFLEELSIDSKSPTPSPPNGTDQHDDYIHHLQPPQNVGWIACTTDEILFTKPNLYDIAIEMPTAHLGHDAKGIKRPIIKVAGEKKEIKATQRDWRRYRLLRRALQPLKKYSKLSNGHQRDADENEESPLLYNSLSTLHDDHSDDEDTERVEPTTWSELAYSSFMWWASAGEKDESILDEENQDISLLGDLAELVHQIVDAKRYKDDDDDDSFTDNLQSPTEASEPARKDARLEMEIISYFHRITKTMFDVCSEIMSNHNHDDDTESDQETPRVGSDALRSMGLDKWNSSDRDFVRAFCQRWFEREVHVDPLGVECCGVRIC